MPGGGCITAGEVRPGQRGRERKLGGTQPHCWWEGCSGHQLLAAGMGQGQGQGALNPTWSGRGSTFLLQKWGCGASRIRRGWVIRHLQGFSWTWRDNPEVNYAPSPHYSQLGTDL